MRFHLVSTCGIPDPVFDDEEPLRSGLLTMFLADMRGQEDFYLAELARAEQGENVDNLYNNLVHVYPERDVVHIEDMMPPSVGETEAEGPLVGTTLTMAEAKQLIHDWKDAQIKWREAHAHEVQPPC